MRITAGRFSGRKLKPPSGLATRPTSDKVRQAVFNILAHNDFDCGFALEGAKVIDLFAGTGALGLEALSRGAAYCLFVEDGAEARGLIRENIEAFGLTGATKLWRRDATKLGAMAPGSGGPFTLAFLDPPYRKDLLAPALEALRDGGWLEANAIAVIECADDETPPQIDRFVTLDDRLYGETRIAILHFMD